MRFKIHKKNALALTVAVFVAVVFVYTMFKSSSLPQDKPKQGTAGSSEKLETLSIAQNHSPNRFLYGSVFEMKKSVYENNFRQFIMNAEMFQSDPELVIVVQVHNRPAYLRLLVESLRETAEIHSTLLIFSHDYFSKEVGEIVQGITFCRVLQIYFPYSLQLYPNEFPGQDPSDCPRDISKDEAKKKGCLNADYPDSYGHYREAAFTQAKHHWWWKLHFVWERVKALQGYSGYAVFIEDDNYLIPDFYSFFKRMAALKKSDCSDCDILALGNHDSPPLFQDLANKVETTGWVSTKHNIGMGLTKDVYYKIMGCASVFCTYDDYNWDWTLQHLSSQCLSKPLKVIAAQASRVLHTGDCGMHQKESCKPEAASLKVQTILQSVKSYLFPDDLVFRKLDSVKSSPHIRNGGWGDIRDHTLCKNYGNKL